MTVLDVLVCAQGCKMSDRRIFYPGSTSIWVGCNTLFFLQNTNINNIKAIEE